MKRVSLDARRWLERDDAEDLEQVGDDHVAKRARLLVEARPPLDVKRLGDVDLNVGDVIAVPDRLEHAVGEPQGEDVLRRLLAQEVVDAVDRILIEHLVERPR